MLKAQAETSSGRLPCGLGIASGGVLVRTRDENLGLLCTTALHERKFEVVTAGSPAAAEYRLRRHNVRGVVFDANILGPVCKEMAGPSKGRGCDCKHVAGVICERGCCLRAAVPLQ